MLKHISSLKGQAAKLSGLREAYFGALLQGVNQTLTSREQAASRDGLDHIVRFVESFQVRGPCPNALKSSFEARITWHTVWSLPALASLHSRNLWCH